MRGETGERGKNIISDFWKVRVNYSMVSRTIHMANFLDKKSTLDANLRVV